MKKLLLLTKTSNDMTKLGDEAQYDDVYGVEHLQSEMRDGDSALREIVRMLMMDDDSQRSGHEDSQRRNQEYSQFIRDAIIFLVFLAALLSVIIIIFLRSVTQQGRSYLNVHICVYFY